MLLADRLAGGQVKGEDTIKYGKSISMYVGGIEGQRLISFSGIVRSSATMHIPTTANRAVRFSTKVMGPPKSMEPTTPLKKNRGTSPLPYYPTLAHVRVAKFQTTPSTSSMLTSTSFELGIDRAPDFFLDYLSEIQRKGTLKPDDPSTFIPPILARNGLRVLNSCCFRSSPLVPRTPSARGSH